MPAVPTKRLPKRLLGAWLPESLLAALPILTAGCSDPPAPPIVGTLERHRIEIAAPANEQIVALGVREGDAVKPGQLLAELDSGTQSAQRDVLAAQVQQARGRLRELQNGARLEERQAAEARLRSAQADLAQTGREYQRQQELAGRGLVAASQLDLQLRARDNATAAVAAAQADLQLLRSGTREEQLAQARAALESSEAQLAQQSIVRARLRLTAPAAGTVEAIPYRLGERPPLGAPVVVLIAADTPFARVYIPEPLRSRVKPGDRVQVRVDGVPAAVAGVVRYIAAEASFTPYYALTQRDRSRLVYVTEIDVPGDTGNQLASGVPVQVELSAPGTP